MEGRKTEKVVLCGSDSCFLACYHFIDCKSNLVLVKKAQRLSAPVLLTILAIIMLSNIQALALFLPLVRNCHGKAQLRQSCHIRELLMRQKAF